MRRPFGGSGRGMGGGGGGGMLRAVQRAVSARSVSGAAQEPFSYSTTTAKPSKTATTTNDTFNNKANNSTALSLSSSLSTLINNLPVSATASVPIWDSESDWDDCLDGCEDERVNDVFCDDYILGPVPSRNEVHHAVSALQQVLQPAYFSYPSKDGLGTDSNEDAADEVTSSINLSREISSSGSVSDWIEPSLHICNSKLLQPYGSSLVYDAFQLLQTEPSIQRMVISLSSDKAVWDAVMNNEVVREIRDSLKQVDAVDSHLPRSSEEGCDRWEGSDGTIETISWIFVNTKAKVMEVIEKIIEFVSVWFQPPEMKKTSQGNRDPFDQMLRTSFFLSLVVLLTVVVARAQNA